MRYALVVTQSRIGRDDGMSDKKKATPMHGQALDRRTFLATTTALGAAALIPACAPAT
jgi:hypothetical protein